LVAAAFPVDVMEGCRDKAWRGAAEYTFSVEALEDIVAELRDAYNRGDWERAQEIWHPEALLAGIASDWKPLSPGDTIESVEQAKRGGIYVLTHGEILPLDESAVLAEGRCRYRHPAGGLADSTVYWVHTFVDGRVYRTGIYTSAEQARAAYEKHGVDLGFTEAAVHLA
jgi:hypothetical protein